MTDQAGARTNAAEQAHRTGLLDTRSTSVTRARYDRTAPVYDAMERLMEGQFAPYREELWSRVRGPRVLEAGSAPAIDLSPRMLELV